MKSGARGRFFISPHALERYIQRHRPHLSRDQALGEMIQLTSAATFVRRDETGREVWRGPKRAPVPRLLFVVAPTSEGALPAVETVPDRCADCRRCHRC